MPVKRARVDPSAASLDPSKTRQLGLVLSRFEFNGLANPNYKAGRFSLKLGYLLLETHLSVAVLYFDWLADEQNSLGNQLAVHPELDRSTHRYQGCRELILLLFSECHQGTAGSETLSACSSQPRWF